MDLGGFPSCGPGQNLDSHLSELEAIVKRRMERVTTRLEGYIFKGQAGPYLCA